jgi:hypothetical protein
MDISNYVKRGWEKSKKILNTVDLYSYNETRKILSISFQKYLGKAKNRTMLKDNPKLYKSIYEYTQNLENDFKNQKSYKGNWNFSNRIKFIVIHDCDITKLKCSCGKSYTWNIYCRFCPDYKRHQLGKPHTDETKLKIRLASISYIEKMKGQLCPRYNVKSIPLIEEYGRNNGYKFMHAENGGEFFIRELGYFLDAYDPYNNIALEVDERHHFKQGKLSDKDLKRQEEIEKFLGCKFIRIKYDSI